MTGTTLKHMMEPTFDYLIPVGCGLLAVISVTIMTKYFKSKGTSKTGEATERSTVDPKELAHFRDGWDSYGAESPYDFWWKGKHMDSMNPLRVPLFRNMLLEGRKPSVDVKQPLSGLKVLDVGCGGGILCEPLAALGAQVTGIEPVEQSVAVAERHLREESPQLKGKLNYVCSTIESFVSKETLSSVDGIVASEVIEHIDNVPLFIKSAHSLLKPGGSLLLTTINQTYLAYVFAIILAERVARLLPVGTHHYDKLVPIEGLRETLAKAGFRVKEIRGQVFNPFTGNWSWIKYTNICYVVVAVKDKEVSANGKP